jgi:hypothetical protein
MSNYFKTSIIAGRRMMNVMMINVVHKQTTVNFTSLGGKFCACIVKTPSSFKSKLVFFIHSPFRRRVITAPRVRTSAGFSYLLT